MSHKNRFACTGECSDSIYRNTGMLLLGDPSTIAPAGLLSSLDFVCPALRKNLSNSLQLK